MSMQIRFSGFVCRSFTMVALLGAATLAASAQTAQPATTLDLSGPAYSSSAQPELTTDAPANETATNAEHFNFLGAMNAMQYGGRRTGRPRYRGGNTNADGSKKYEFFAGVGLSQPVGNTYHYLNPSYAFQVGAGRNFNSHVGVDVQFDYDHFGFNKRTLDNQYNLYNALISEYNATAPAADQISSLTSLDGSSHVWSFTIDPKYNLYSSEGIGAYVVAGGGFYHKVADFTVPTVEEYYDPYYGPEEYEANATFDHYFSNAPGINGGFGLTYKFSRFSGEQLYAEARYVYVFTSQRQGVTVANFNPNSVNEANDYPANSNRTSYVPIKFGIRF
jgi:hypothetical protein